MFSESKLVNLFSLFSKKLDKSKNKIKHSDLNFKMAFIVEKGDILQHKALDHLIHSFLQI